MEAGVEAGAETQQAQHGDVICVVPMADAIVLLEDCEYRPIGSAIWVLGDWDPASFWMWDGGALRGEGAWHLGGVVGVAGLLCQPGPH